MFFKGIVFLLICFMLLSCSLFHKSAGNTSTIESIHGKNVGAEKLMSADEKSLRKLPKYKMEKQLIF